MRGRKGSNGHGVDPGIAPSSFVHDDVGIFSVKLITPGQDVFSRQQQYGNLFPFSDVSRDSIEGPYGLLFVDGEVNGVDGELDRGVYGKGEKSSGKRRGIRRRRRRRSGKSVIAFHVSQRKSEIGRVPGGRQYARSSGVGSVIGRGRSIGLPGVHESSEGVGGGGPSAGGGEEAVFEGFVVEVLMLRGVEGGGCGVVMETVSVVVVWVVIVRLFFVVVFVVVFLFLFFLREFVRESSEADVEPAVAATKQR
mmetsp:Transcript_5369/g.11883  ORF Transcript_5369/g.11883 Transcript_5369/m.11883 type:complete len:251 (+) Transcript_5369:1128-1880(+)